MKNVSHRAQAHHQQTKLGSGVQTLIFSQGRVTSTCRWNSNQLRYTVVLVKLSLVGLALSFLIAAGAAGQNPAPQTPSSGHFYWSIRKAHELDYHRTIRNSPNLNSVEKATLIKTIASLVRPYMKDNEINSERELITLAANTRVELIDLDGDGVPEIIAQANDIKMGCGATGNCTFWVLKKVSESYKLLLDTSDNDGIGGAELLTVGNSRTNGFSDLVLAAHDSASEKTLFVLRYRNGIYRETACYDASWVSTEGGKWRDLNDPVIGMISCQ